MSIMELDPPDYWLLRDPRGDHPLGQTWRIWAVDAMYLPGREQVLLARIDPPYFVYGIGDVDFIALKPVRQCLRLHPVRPGATVVELFAYSGHYTGQSTVTRAELDRQDEYLALAGEELALPAIAYATEHWFLPDNARETTPPARGGCLLGAMASLVS